MKFPKSIKVIGHDIEIKKRKRFIAEKGNVYGRSRLCQAQIIIAERDRWKNKISEDYQKNTFLHEIVHHINDKQETHLTERQVSRLTDGLYQVLKDNKIRF